ncbi:MAG: apolipoprotein N-acyltransferase, partial [Planctomycetaceae bacterium]
SEEVKEVLGDMSGQSGAALIICLEAAVATQEDLKIYNSAAFVRPDVGYVGRYDKIHLLAFGEYLPLKEQLPWLHKFTPFPPDYGLDAGESMPVFDDGRWQYAALICFEDTVPHLVREYVASARGRDGEPVDVLVNLTNDGWFHGRTELDQRFSGEQAQHLVTAAFRCVETRTPMVRSVNTGISAVIDGDGVVREPVKFLDGDGDGRATFINPETGEWTKGLNAVVIDDVPLDDRRSLSLAGGDWFAMACCAGMLLALFAGLLPRRWLNSSP